jgi:CBS domain containing-hemolysin-like protein
MDVATQTPATPVLDTLLAGLQAGMMAVLVMLGWLGLSALWHGRTFWTAPNQMATLFHGGSAIGPGFGPYTASGLAVYVLIYSLLGAGFALLVPARLTPLGMMLAGVLLALAWYALWFRALGQTVMPLVWLLHSERPTVFGHVLYGVLLARFPVYLQAGPESHAKPVDADTDPAR